MRRFYEYLLLAALIAVAVIATVALTYEPPRQRPPLRYSDIYSIEPPDRSAPVSAEIDVHRNCLVLADGRDFDCAHSSP